MKVFNKVFVCIVISLAVCFLFSLKSQAVHSGGGNSDFIAPNGRTYSFYYRVGFPEYSGSYCEDGLYELWSDYPAALVLSCELDGLSRSNCIVYFDQVNNSFTCNLFPVDSSYYCLSFPSKNKYNSGQSDGNLLFQYPYTTYTHKFELISYTLPILDTLDDFQASLVPDPDNYVYFAELGYLADMDKLTRFSYVEGEDAFNTQNYKFNWASITTSGIDLHNHTYDSLQIQPMVFATLHTYDDSGDLIDSRSDSYTWDSFDSSADGWSISFNDLKKALPSIYDMQVLLGRDHNWSVDSSYYFRLLAWKDGEYYRGGWVKVKLEFMEDDQLQVDAVAGDIIGGVFTVDPTSPYGPGSSTIAPIDTIVNPDRHPQIDSDSGIIDSLQGVLQEVGQVPMVVAALFSFLPKWCLDLLAVSFGFMIFLLVIKTVRG